MGIIEDGDFENNAIQISEDGVMENDEKFENDMMEILKDDWGGRLFVLVENGESRKAVT